MKLKEKQRRRNTMSYMIAIKGKYGFAIASDSYSCYSDRSLKDAHYKKIHQFTNGLIIGSAGVNVVYNNQEELIDINSIYSQYFENVSDYNQLLEQIQLFAQFVQTTCNRELKDYCAVFYFLNKMVVLNILHSRGIYIEQYQDNEYDIIFMGEEEHKYHAREYFSRSDMLLSPEMLQSKCISSVDAEITYEKELYEEGYQVVGGDVQSLLVSYK